MGTTLKVAGVGIDPAMLAGMATERLEAEITTWAGHLAAATCHWLLHVGEYDRRKGYEEWECVSAAQWLGLHVGISPVTARQHVAVARQLLVLRRVREAFGRGELSFSRVRAICRVATPDDEQRWVELAVHATGHQLERIVCDTIRSVNAADPDQSARQAESRRLSWVFDDDGMCRLNAMLPPEIGALLGSLLRTERDDSLENTDEVEKRNADAFARLLLRLARTAPDAAESLARDAAASLPAPDGAASPVSGGADPATAPVMIIVHVQEDGTARLEGGPPISGELVERLGVGAEYVVATHSEDAIRYGRRQRTPPPAMRRYLQARDRGCRFDGCDATKGLHAHHIKEYVAETGETVPANMVMLCSRHHGAIHRRGWTVSGNPETGALVFRNPASRPYEPNRPTTGDPATIAEHNRSNGIEPAPDTITPKGHGARYDHELTVWIMANATIPPRPDAAASAR